MAKQKLDVNKIIKPSVQGHVSGLFSPMTTGFTTTFNFKAMPQTRAPFLRAETTFGSPFFQVIFALFLFLAIQFPAQAEMLSTPETTTAVGSNPFLGCNEAMAFNCDPEGLDAVDCDIANFVVSEGGEFLPGADFLDGLSPDGGDLGTGIPDTLLTVFDAGEVEGFFGVIRRNAPGAFPIWSAGAGYQVPAGYSPLSTSNSTLSELSTWNMIGYVDLGSYNFSELSVELLFDLDPAAGTLPANFSSLSLSASLGTAASITSSFASNQNPASSTFTAIIGEEDFMPFNPEVLGEYGIGIRIVNACGEVLLEQHEVVEVIAGISGCDQPAACNYQPGATLSAPCDFISCLSLGCTDPTACNYDPTAIFEDGSCDYSCYTSGCTNPAACNYNPAAAIEDGSCDFSSCSGCVDPAADNYDPEATIDNGSCEYLGCLNPLACNFDSTANASDGSCEYQSCAGCGNPEACNFDSTATIVDNATCVFAAVGYDCSGNCLADSDGDGVCDANEVPGCTDEGASNYDPLATDDDGACEFGVSGCTNPLACNFNASATDDDGTCEFTTCIGCTSEEACNFDANALFSDNSTCTYPEAGYDCDGNCLSDLDFDGICAEFEVLGCTDESALNFDALATDLDGSCLYPPVCQDTTACDVDPYEAYCIQVEVFETHDGMVGTTDLTGMTTYRIYALCEDSTDVVSSVAGDDEFPTYLSSTGDVYQSEFGGAFAQDISPGIVSFIPELAFDSWLTIGLEGPPGASESGAMSVEGLDPWISNFEETGTLAIQDSVGGLWFVLDNPENAVAGPDMRVLLAQITTNGTLTGSLLVQFFQQGDGPNAAIKKFININEACMLPSTEGCEYAADGYDCSGNCLSDSDGDGVCDDNEVPGCQDELACNYDALATDDAGNCEYAEGLYDCEGNCVDDADGDGVCDAEEVNGCTDATACNFASDATEDNGSCVFAATGYDCDGNCLSDVDGDGVCDLFEVFGCADATACNFAPDATEDNGSCVFAAVEYDCDGNCLSDLDADGVCDAFEIPGCTDPEALNFDENATDDDGSCEADPCNPDVAPPYFTFVPADSTITCDQPMPIGMAMAEDECSEVVVTFVDGPIEYIFDCPPFNYFCTRTFTAVDAAGNFADTVQYISVVDTIAPEFIFVPQDTIYVDEALGQTIPIGEVAVEDACDLMADWSYEDFVQSSENDTTTIERIFTASDQCGNESEWTQIIVVYEAILGCTDATACNYDDLATADDGTCLYPAEGYDCDGACLDDADGDGICDAFEIPGCTAPNACNFDEFATDEDDSCDFCSCAEGVFGNYGLEIETVAEHTEGDLAGMTTYRFYVATASADDFVSSVYGSDEDTLILHTTTAWHQDPLGANYAQSVNTSLYGMFPELAFDSWLTIGLEGPADLAAGEQEVTTLGPPTDGWLTAFAAGNSIQIDDVVGGAWFVLNGATNGVAGEDQRVLVAQLTTDGDISGRINAQIFGDGLGANDLRFSFDFEGTEWLNNGGLTNNCGCTDATAYNYDDEADYDDGACAYCALDITEVETMDVSCFGGSDGSVQVFATGGSTDTLNFAFTPGGPDGLDSLWTDIAAGSFEVVVSDGNGCADTASFEIAQPEQLVLTLDEVLDQTEGQTDGAISITITGGTPDYITAWTGLDGGFSSADEDIDGLLAGAYDVLVTDANGCTVALNEILVEFIAGVSEQEGGWVEIWPNPSRDILHLTLPSSLAAERPLIQILDMRGQLVFEQFWIPGNARQVVDVSGWSTGQYVVLVQTASALLSNRLQVSH